MKFIMTKRNIKIISGLIMLFFSFLSGQAQLSSPGGIDMTINERFLELWIDGDNSTTTSWPNLVPAVYSLEGGVHRPAIRNSRLNFHREMYFGNQTNSKMRTTANYIIQSGRAYYAFVVADNQASGIQILLSYNPTTNDGNAVRTSLHWNEVNIRAGWNGTLYQINNSQRYGIASMNIMNGGASTAYMNSTASNFNASNQNITGSRLYIGSGNNNMTSTGAGGNNRNNISTIQEVIVMNGNSQMSDTDVQKIHSYLAIKYGITLNTSDYLNSDGTVIWNRTTNNGFNNNIFGIARDDATLLNQVQSRSSNSNILTVYLDALNTLNNNSSTAFEKDKSHVILGSNNLNIATDVAYINTIETAFENVAVDIKTTYRSALIYRAQVTNNGAQNGSQTVNIQLNSTRQQYVIVSDNPAFPAGSTRIYPITNRIANNVLINDGDYISFAGFEAFPGGLTGYSIDVWIDGNNSTNAAWPNLAIANHTMRRLSVAAPVVRNSKFNFHKELYFGNNGRSKLVTSARYNTTTGEGYHSFVVSENKQSGEQTLIAFNGTGSEANARRASLQWSGSNQVRGNWRASGTAWGNNTLQNFGITSLTVRNTTGANGMLYTSSATNATNFNVTQFSGGNPLALGNGSPTNSTANSGNRFPFNGSMQEVIILRGSNDIMNPNNVRRINSYLAIKYGITLSAGDYLNSNGNTIWSRSENAGYANNIFGIARDDATNLYQKQSRSTTFSPLTIMANGSRLKTLNSENSGTLKDNQYFMAGSNGGSAVMRLQVEIEPGAEYQNGIIDEDLFPLNITTPIYKAQWTGFSDDLASVTMLTQKDFHYALISIDEYFMPENTKIYPVVQGYADMDFTGEYKYFRFVGFAPGPGGVVAGLNLWLRADDEATITTTSTDASGVLAGYNPINSEDSENLPSVVSWSDFVREHDFEQVNNTGSNNYRTPVLRKDPPEMNFHDAVYFWYSGSNRAYLRNEGNILNVARPAAHSALFVINNRYTNNDNVRYNMLFTNNNGQHRGPGYEINRSGTDIRGRFKANRSNNTGGDGLAIGTTPLFNDRATAIAGYYPVMTGAGNNVNTTFRFNALEDTKSCQYNGDTDMRSPSQLGSGIDANRTLTGFMSEAILYNRELDLGEKRKVESYLALKYGITLRPENTSDNGTGRFNYVLSDGSIIWKGDVTDINDPFVKHYNNIAAIVRDDFGKLNNQHAHSTHPGSLLHIGIAGTVLRSDAVTAGTVDFWKNDMEVVIFGDDRNIGFTENNEDCGDFTYRFNRIWYIHKISDDPIPLLVGAQDKSRFFGADALTTEYYEKLVPKNDIFLIIADSREDIVNGNYNVIIPMVLMNDIFQCNYTFSEEDTYITFGYKPNLKGCYAPEEARFEGVKTFQWTQYTRRTNRSNATELSIPAPGAPNFNPVEVNLGDDIVVMNTKLVYPNGVRANRGYPRASNAPGRGGLEIRRSRGSVDQDIVITINFNNPVIPHFSISGIDDYRYASYDEVTISGICSGSTYYPVLTPANRTPSYVINENTVTANKRARLAGGNKNGTVDVEFLGAVEQIEIRYRLKNRVRGTQRIFISPIKLYTDFPPPPINEDGLGFTKQSSAIEVTTCEPVTYTFIIFNTNCEDKYVSFKDELNQGMRWEYESLALDTINILHNPKLEVNDYEGNIKLEIKDLLVPGTSEIKLKATAIFDENANGGEYINRATIEYEKKIMDAITGETKSVDRMTLNEETSTFVYLQEERNELQIEVMTSGEAYIANSIMEITYKIINPGEEITDMFMDVDFNENFYYIKDSFTYQFGGDEEGGESSNNAPTAVNDAELNPNYLSIAGDVDAIEGFTLPSGATYLRFKIKIPVFSNIGNELDEKDQPTGHKEPLVITYEISSDMDDPCMIESMVRMSGDISIPYSSNIITNKNITTRIKR